jgi:hypothetical protein
LFDLDVDPDFLQVLFFLEFHALRRQVHNAKFWLFAWQRYY